LEYYSYVFFPIGFLTGPFLEFKQYIAFTNRSVFKDNNGEIPSSWGSSIIKLFIALVAVGMNRVHKFFPDIYTTTDEFYYGHSFLYRVLYMVICCELGTSKYYFAFSMGEVSANICGISYNGKDEHGNAKWDKIVMTRLWEFKTAISYRGLVDHWNVPTQVWLKNYVFLRIIKKVRSRIFAVFATFFTSAFWHGFYGGYYCFFLTGALCTVAGDVLGQNVWPLFYNKDGTPKSASHQLCDLLGWFATFWTITYITISFRLLSIDYALKAWSSIYFVHHFCAIAVIILFKLFPLKSREKTRDQ